MLGMVFFHTHSMRKFFSSREQNIIRLDDENDQQTLCLDSCWYLVNGSWINYWYISLMTKSERNELSLSDQDSMMAQKYHWSKKKGEGVHLMVMMVGRWFRSREYFLLWFSLSFRSRLSLSLSLFVYSRLNSRIKRESDIVQHERD